MKKFLSLFLTALMVISTVTISANAANASYTDTKTHWASSCIESWSGYGVIKGYDGKFSPDRSMTRGEFAVVIDRILKYQTAAENVFKDLKQDFYTDAILKLNKSQVMKGDGDTVRPNATITREESAVMLCRALGIAEENSISKSFSDTSKVSSWATGFINAMVNSGLLNGSDGKLNPQKPITRAEVVKILDNAILPVLTSGEVTNVSTNKIMVISSPNVVITNSALGGKIMITQGVTEGMVTFMNTRIKGEIAVDNARSDGFVRLQDCSVAKETISKLDKMDTVIQSGTKEDTLDEEIKEDTKKEEENKDTDKDKENNNNSGGGGGGGDDSSNNNTTTTTQYTVTFNSNGGSAVASQTVNSGSKATTPVAPTKANYSFTGWYTESTCTTKYNFDTAVTKNITLYAGWEKVEVPCTVSFDTDGGSTVASQTVNKGSKAERPADPTKDGYVFVNWYKDSALSNVYNFNTTVTSDITIYAKWKKVHTVTFVNLDTDMNKIDDDFVQTIEDGKKATEPGFKDISGWQNTGWYTDESFTEEYSFSQAVNDDITLYGQWVNIADHNEEPINRLNSIIAGLDACIADTGEFQFDEMIEILEEVKDCIYDAVDKATTDEVLLTEEFISKNFGSRISAVSYMTEALNDIPVEDYPDGFYLPPDEDLTDDNEVTLEGYFFTLILEKLEPSDVEYIFMFFGKELPY